LRFPQAYAKRAQGLDIDFESDIGVMNLAEQQRHKLRKTMVTYRLCGSVQIVSRLLLTVLLNLRYDSNSPLLGKLGRNGKQSVGRKSQREIVTQPKPRRICWRRMQYLLGSTKLQLTRRTCGYLCSASLCC
jgi:hypothetical protein